MSEARVVRRPGRDEACALQAEQVMSGASSRSVPSICAAAGLLGSCDGPQSALATAGDRAGEVATLFWVMTVGGAIIWLAVTGLSIYAFWSRRTHENPKFGRRLIVWGGVIFPSIVLIVLLAYSLEMLPRTLARGPENSIRIRVSGEQWWWRVQYAQPGGALVDLANEIHLPIDTPVEFELVSPDVIHSFWIPSLGGKMDMIPGRTTWLTLYPRKPGVFRGVCAEYCGASHAWMAFPVVVHERAAYDQWLAHQAQPAALPVDPIAKQGEHVFLANGCGACHAVRGTVASGRVGPDLTHVGSRRTLGAGRMENEASAVRAWIASPTAFKPGAHMPAFSMLAEPDLHALAAYMESLR